MYLGYFFLSLFLSVVLTPLVYVIMYKLGIVDEPKAAARKIHKKKIPLGGGWAIFLSFFIVVFLAWQGKTIGQEVLPKHLLALFIGGLVLMIGGILDDKFNLRPIHQIWFPVVASVVIIAFGIGPHAFTNPIGGGLLDVSRIKISFGSLGNLILIADAIVFVWLMGMMFTTKFLDGLDGLVAGVVSIGALVLFGFSIQDQWLQPDVALLSIMFAGACLGFLIWNWHPAKIFLGEGGSLFAGFILGTLAIISGAKIATTLLVVAVPAIDVARVIIRRIQKGRSIAVGDNEHLHFKLVASGMTHRQVVFFMYAISGAIGLSALYLKSFQKFIALSVVLIIMILIGFWLAKKEQLSRANIEYGK